MAKTRKTKKTKLPKSTKQMKAAEPVMVSESTKQKTKQMKAAEPVMVSESTESTVTPTPTLTETTESTEIESETEETETEARDRAVGAKVRDKESIEVVHVPRIPFSQEFDGSDELREHNAFLVDKLYNELKDSIVGFKRSSSTGESIIGGLSTLTVLLMEGARTFRGVTGTEKKVIVLRVARRVLSEIEMPADTHVVLTATVNFVLPRLIDLVIAAADGKLDLGRTKKALQQFFCCGAPPGVEAVVAL